MSAADDKEIWTAADVAAHLRVSRSWVYQASDRNELPHAKVGSCLRFSAAKIRAWFAAKEVKRGVVLHPRD